MIWYSLMGMQKQQMSSTLRILPSFTRRPSLVQGIHSSLSPPLPLPPLPLPPLPLPPLPLPLPPLPLPPLPLPPPLQPLAPLPSLQILAHLCQHLLWVSSIIPHAQMATNISLKQINVPLLRST